MVGGWAPGRTWAGSPGQEASVKKAAEASAAKRRKFKPPPTGRRYAAAQVPSGGRMRTAAPPFMGGRRNPAMAVGPKGRRTISSSAPPVPMMGRGRPQNWNVKTVTSHGNTFKTINNVAVQSTEADFNTPEVVNKKLSQQQRIVARARSGEIFNAAVGNAPAIQAAIRDVVAKNNGTMGRELDPHTGMPTAVKSEHSTYRKVQKKMEDAQSKGKTLDPKDIHLGDGVRFTALFNDESYVSSVAQLQQHLTAQGYTMVDPPPDAMGGGWALGPYRGLNMTFEHPDGMQFEVQAHTQASMDTAEAIHPYYDVSRSNDDQVAAMMADTSSKGAKAKTGIDPAGLTPAQYKEKAHQASLDMAEKVPVPKGLNIIGGKDMWHDVVFTAPTTGHYSSRTGARIAPPGPPGLAAAATGPPPSTPRYNTAKVSSGARMKRRAPAGAKT